MKSSKSGVQHKQLSRLMDVLGYHFHDEKLLTLALRHPSLGTQNNQRLEYLGDAVLQLMISHRLYDQYPELHEGALTQLRQKLVCEKALADIARRIDLGSFLSMDHGCELTGVRTQDGPLSDAMEAVLAAVYLDGGFECTRLLINSLWPERASFVEDAKSRLQEHMQAQGQSAPVYELIHEDGPDHARVFTVRVRLASGETAEGQGNSKKRAEQNAAGNMLTILGEKPVA